MINEKVKLSWYENIMRGRVQHYDRKKYWKYRDKVLNYSGGIEQVAVHILSFLH